STDAASTLTVTGYNYPSGTLVQGASFSIKGTVSSNYKIKSLTVGIYNASGAAVSTKTVNPNAKSYSIKNVDSYVKFGAAKAGTNYYKITATDEKVTKTLVNKSYTVKSNDPESTLKATNCNYPTTLEEGKSYSIKGTITSNYKITSVTVGIYNASGAGVSTKTVNPNATSYSIASIDAYIKFGAAKAGTNYYKITASDTKKSATLLNQKYTVTAKQAAASTLALSGHTVPTTLNVGQSFSIKGSITSNYKITSVTVGIYNANGGAVSTKTVAPNSKSFSIATIDAYIKFGDAKAGTNYYKIVATDEKITKTLLNQAYTVKSNDVASTLAISGHNVPPAELDLGKSFTIKGTVSSNYNITSLTVGIYNANGGEVSVKTVSPNAKSYSISNVDAYIKFGQAQPGTNYYRIKATDQKTTKTLVDSAYNVKGSTASSSLAISGHNVPPAELGLGKSFSIYGTVSSNYNITSLTVGIYTESGTPVSTKTISPNAKSYSISKIDAYIKFGAAGKGVHYYKIVATDSKQTKTLVNSKYTVVNTTTSVNVQLTGDYATDIVAVAKTQIGKTGRPNDYTRWYGPVGDPLTYSYAWCAAFTSWCANQAGIPKSVIPPECSCSRMVTAFKNLGSDIIKDPSTYDPVKGDILFFDNANSGGSYDHVGIVVSYDKSTGAITTIEGNTSSASQANGDTVAQKTRYKNTSGFKVSAFAHPKYPTPTTPSSSSSPVQPGNTISAAQAKKIAGDITAAYEGGYEAIAGDGDGQGISVGFFQWNIGTGSLQPMLSDFLNNHTSEAKSVFGEDKYNGLKTMLGKSSRADQLSWVRSNIIVSGGTKVKDDWKACLKSMCRTDSFKAIEVEAAENWFNQGKVMFNRYKLTTLRSYCLCIDIAVQNWDVKDYMGSTSGKTEKQIQQMLVEAAVAKSKQAYKDDVRSRKGTIVNGSGVVHETNFYLDRDYGLTDQVISW
ncbi:MAG: CHAP domain-containing protein, partial [Acutalibacteraceae bacterium]